MQNTQTISRLQSIDALRGLVIVIMLLDHVRETFYLHKQVSDPMNVAETEPALFWSRILAHLCAPVFVMLTGMSAYLFQLKTQSLQQTRAFLFKRGLFLIFLELTLVNFAWTAKFPPDVIYLQVIWAIGISMVVLAAAVGLPKKLLFALGLTIVFGHNALDGLSFSQGSALQNIWLILHERGWIELESLKMRTTYPVLPWIGVIFIGYGLGQFFNPSLAPKQRDRTIICIALTCIALFFIIRFSNIYGDHMWQHYASHTQTIMSFFNLTKYPPSLLFILWNIGIGLFALVLFERFIHSKLLKPLVVLGSVPMFFYLLHLFVLKLIYVVCVAVWGVTSAGYFSFHSVYQVWLFTVLLTLALYPVVKKFSHFKHANKHISWLKYF